MLSGLTLCYDTTLFRYRGMFNAAVVFLSILWGNRRFAQLLDFEMDAVDSVKLVLTDIGLA